MAFTAKQFGRKLATIRNAFGQDREALAVSSGIQAERLALLEEGATEPTGDEVLIFSAARGIKVSGKSDGTFTVTSAAL